MPMQCSDHAQARLPSKSPACCHESALTCCCVAGEQLGNRLRTCAETVVGCASGQGQTLCKCPVKMCTACLQGSSSQQSGSVVVHHTSERQTSHTLPSNMCIVYLQGSSSQRLGSLFWSCCASCRRLRRQTPFSWPSRVCSCCAVTT